MRLAVMELDLVRHGNRWRVAAGGSSSQTLNSNVAAEDPQVAAAVRPSTRRSSPTSTHRSGRRCRDVGRPRARRGRADHRLRQLRPGRRRKQGLTGRDASLPVLSIAAPFNRQASFPSGQVSIRDVAGLYIYDNTLLGVKVTGQEVKDYLEYSVRYFKQVSGTGPFTMTRSPTRRTRRRPRRRSRTTTSTRRRPRRSADLRRRHRPAGRLADHEPAVRRRRDRPGGGVRDGGEQLPPERRRRLPRGEDAPVVYNRQIDIRQLLIDWVTAHHTIDPRSSLRSTGGSCRTGRRSR